MSQWAGKWRDFNEKHRNRGKAAIETQMIHNHKAAIEFLVESINEAQFNRYTTLNLHSSLAENILATQLMKAVYVSIVLK